MKRFVSSLLMLIITNSHSPYTPDPDVQLGAEHGPVTVFASPEVTRLQEEKDALQAQLNVLRAQLEASKALEAAYQAELAKHSETSPERESANQARKEQILTLCQGIIDAVSQEFKEQSAKAALEADRRLAVIAGEKFSLKQQRNTLEKYRHQLSSKDLEARELELKTREEELNNKENFTHMFNFDRERSANQTSMQAVVEQAVNAVRAAISQNPGQSASGALMDSSYQPGYSCY